VNAPQAPHLQAQALIPQLESHQCEGLLLLPTLVNVKDIKAGDELLYIHDPEACVCFGFHP
jgi:hypothetical protein